MKAELQSVHCVEIEGIGSRGEGIARLDDLEIFIPKTMRGDRVEIRIQSYKKGRAIGELIRILTPSPERAAARCRHFESCGGCDFQHLPYDDQLAWKLRMTKHWIRRSSLAPDLDRIPFDTIASPKTLHYRHRVRLQVKKGRLHFFLPHSNTLLPLDECPVLIEGFFEKLSEVAAQMPDAKDWNQSAFHEYTLDGRRLQFDESCFTQANLGVNEQIWSRIKDDIELVERKSSALDLYCGIGNFTLGLADRFESVIGVESEGRSIEWAKKNLEGARLNHRATIRVGFCEKVAQELENERKAFDFVVLDPPRQGALETCRILTRISPPRITYVSCNLESLIHDLILLKKSGYKILRWTVADMFPQTHHIESIVSLVRGA